MIYSPEHPPDAPGQSAATSGVRDFRSAYAVDVYAFRGNTIYNFWVLW